MTRKEAAALLGVDDSASPDDVRRAWRVWARLAHPDLGGDVRHFRRLAAARDELLAGTPLDPNPELEPAPRAPMCSVIRRPSLPAAVVTATLVIGCLAVVMVGRLVDPWLVALALGLTSTCGVVVLQRAMLARQADVGHRISFLALTWIPLAVCLAVVTEAMGSSIVTALPALVLPFVAAVAFANPGAGLWRPLARVDFSR